MVELDSTPALLVIDMQNAFCHDQGSFAKMGIKTDPTAIVPHINELRAAFLKARIPVYFVRTMYNADYSDRRPHDRGDSVEKLGGLLVGSWDAEMIDELAPKPHEGIVNKTRNSAFLGKCSLNEILKERGVNHLFLTGVGTNVTTVSDATNTCTESDHLAALHALRLFGGTASTAEVIEAF